MASVSGDLLALSDFCWPRASVSLDPCFRAFRIWLDNNLCKFWKKISLELTEKSPKIMRSCLLIFNLMANIGYRSLLCGTYYGCFVRRTDLLSTYRCHPDSGWALALTTSPNAKNFPLCIHLFGPLWPKTEISRAENNSVPATHIALMVVQRDNYRFSSNSHRDSHWLWDVTTTRLV